MSTFSRTVMFGNSALDCGTWATPLAQDLGRAQAVEPRAVEPDLALARAQEPADRAQHGRLAGAVGPDDAGDRAAGDLEVDALEHVAAAVARDHAAQPQHQTPTSSSTKSAPR